MTEYRVIIKREGRFLWFARMEYFGIEKDSIFRSNKRAWWPCTECWRPFPSKRMAREWGRMTLEKKVRQDRYKEEVEYVELEKPESKWVIPESYPNVLEETRRELDRRVEEIMGREKERKRDIERQMRESERQVRDMQRRFGYRASR